MKMPLWAAPLALSWLVALPPVASSQDAPTTIQEALERWRAANQSVAEFPRGHIDLLRWEQSQSAAASPTANPTTAVTWPEVWRDIQRQRAEWVLPPSANALERRAAQRDWLALHQEAQAAWANAITQHALLRVHEERVHAARTAQALGERMAALGHWSQAQLIPVQLAGIQEQTAHMAAQSQAQAAVERLARLSGLSNSEAIDDLIARLPKALPMPEALTWPPNAEAQALAQRPEHQWKGQQVEREVQAVSEAHWRRWAQARDGLLQGQIDQAPQWTARVAMGDHALSKAIVARAAWEREGRAIGSTVRQAWQQLERSRALDVLMHEQRLPLQQQAEQETLLRYNGMLKSTWDMIDAAQARLSAQADALKARQAHALAHADWLTLMAGGDVELSPPAAPAGNNPAAPKGH
jgi:outer membrane protein TolC